MKSRNKWDVNGMGFDYGKFMHGDDWPAVKEVHDTVQRLETELFISQIEQGSVSGMKPQTQDSRATAIIDALVMLNAAGELDPDVAEQLANRVYEIGKESAGSVE
jgi:hypothetical protein